MPQIFLDGALLTLREWQRKSGEELVNLISSRKPPAVILNEPPGSGKTVTVLYALASLMQRGESAVVLVPNVPIISMWTKYRVVADDGSEIPVVGIYGKQRFVCWLNTELRADSPQAVCNFRTSTGEKISKCRFYAPTTHTPTPPLQPLGSYSTFGGGKLYVNINVGGACDYYRQFQLYLSPGIYVMTYEKFLIEMAVGRLPKFKYLVLDEVETAFEQMLVRVDVTPDLVREILNYLKGADFSVYEQADALIRDIERGAPISISVFSQLIRVATERGYQPPYGLRLAENGRQLGRRGHVVLYEMYFFKAVRMATALGAFIIGLTGTPLAESDVSMLFPKAPVVSNRRRALGRYYVYLDGQIPVKGVWFKHPKAFRQEVEGVCRRTRELIELARSMRLPVFVPVVSYSVVRECGLDKTYGVDEDGSHIEQFANGERDVLVSARASRGVHFPHRRIAVVIPKYPFPDVSDPLVSYLLTTRYKDYITLGAKAVLYQILGRNVTSDENEVLVLTPDSRVVEEVLSLKRSLEIDIVEVRGRDVERVLGAGELREGVKEDK
ncbi:MAG: DEAD/DEAH box helicase family protein [Pyrobaculum sp.]